MIPPLSLSMADASTTSSGASTGAKYFGTGLAAQANANPNLPFKYNGIVIAGLAVVGVLGFIYIQKKVR